MQVYAQLCLPGWWICMGIWKAASACTQRAERTLSQDAGADQNAHTLAEFHP